MQLARGTLSADPPELGHAGAVQLADVRGKATTCELVAEYLAMPARRRDETVIRVHRG
jgi:hypothetical protein